jgi:DNA-binding winged helix-turn-helix (wHTH) protein
MVAGSQDVNDEDDSKVRPAIRVLLVFFRKPMRLGFGDCVFDSDTRELTRSGRAVHVSPKAFRLLELLLTSRPRALSKSELKDAIWPKTFVLETNLANLVAELRAAVGEIGRQSRLIRTVHGFGYSFSGEARGEGESKADEASFRLLLGEEELRLLKGRNVVGRDRSAEIFLDDSTVSRRHARIVVDGPNFTIEDLGSKNGTFVSGRKVEGVTALKDGDEIQIGSVFLTFQAAPESRSTATARRRSTSRRLKAL